MSLTKVPKLKDELDSLEVRIQQRDLKLQSLIPDKEGELGEPLFFKEESHERLEVNCDLPPKFDELENEELQVSDFEQCGVFEGIEELLSQEECPHLQQESRNTLAKKEGLMYISYGVLFILST